MPAEPFPYHDKFLLLHVAPKLRVRYIRMMDTSPDQNHAVGHPDARTVLVVEDESLVRMPIAEFLRDCGYNVLEAADASEAIATMDAADGVSLVFTDIRMPGAMDGFGFAEWCQSHYPSVPVLLTSGYNGGRKLPVAASPGSCFIEKPYSQTQVARRIAALLDS